MRTHTREEEFQQELTHVAEFLTRPRLWLTAQQGSIPAPPRAAPAPSQSMTGSPPSTLRFRTG